MEISGRRILITGAGRGLGRALAIACARAGAREVIAAARRMEDAGALPAAAGRSAGRIRPMRLDVTRDEDARDAASLGRVDILINNAGAIAFGGALKGRMDEILREVEVNYLGVLRMVRWLAPTMAERGDGMIVNVASQLARVSAPAVGTYCATKAALLSLSQALRGDLADRGVRVIAVLPGAIDTDMTRGLDIPKMAPEEAAVEILQAIRDETIEAPIGDEARRTLAGLAADPLDLEKRFARFRA
ncbi:MAG: SDR family NAD(P)-dependent oxidoreductase [Acidobacteriota bacterium]